MSKRCLVVEETAQCLTDFGSIVGSAEDELRCPVVTRADVRDIGLVLDENLGAAKIAQLQNATVGIEKQILRLNVAVTDALGVDVGQGSEELIDVEFDLENRHRGLGLVEESRGSVDSLRNEFLDQVEVHFILL